MYYMNIVMLLIDDMFQNKYLYDEWCPSLLFSIRVYHTSFKIQNTTVYNTQYTKDNLTTDC